jgi:hypothetical protein
MVLGSQCPMVGDGLVRESFFCHSAQFYYVALSLNIFQVEHKCRMRGAGKRKLENSVPQA